MGPVSIISAQSVTSKGSTGGVLPGVCYQNRRRPFGMGIPIGGHSNRNKLCNGKCVEKTRGPLLFQRLQFILIAVTPKLGNIQVAFAKMNIM